MIKLSQAIIVEGKYDKIKLASIFDALIIELNGFGIFKDKEKAQLISALAKSRGIIILTDSDSAGNIIRNHIKNIVKDGKIYNAYVEPIKGKEKRKAHSSAEGLLGVEGMEKQSIIDAVKRCGIEDGFREIADNDRITNLDLYNFGISGGKDSKTLRTALLKHLKLPQNLSKNNLLRILEYQYTRTELAEILTKIMGDSYGGKS